MYPDRLFAPYAVNDRFEISAANPPALNGYPRLRGAIDAIVRIRWLGLETRSCLY